MKQTTKSLLSAILVTLLLRSASSFVVHSKHLGHVQVATSTSVTTTELALSSQIHPYDPQPHKENPGILKKIANFFTPWWLKHKEEEADETDTEDVDVILSPKQRTESMLASREMYDGLPPIPWAFRATGDAITKAITRDLSREMDLAKPLLKDAQKLIQRDKDLVRLLGTPIHMQPIFSRSSSTSRVNLKETKRIVEKFVVEGPKEQGVATLTADKYKRGHILALRVDVSGIHYDIETKSK